MRFIYGKNSENISDCTDCHSCFLFTVQNRGIFVRLVWKVKNIKEYE